MPRFYFHLKEGDYLHPDDVGHDLAGLDEAEEQATMTAASLLKDAAAAGKYDDVCVEVHAAGLTVITVCASLKVRRKP